MVETKKTDEVSDITHYTATVPSDSIEIDATSVKTLGVTFRNKDGKKYDGYTAGWFASSQLLKLCEKHITKTDLRDMDNVGARNSIIENNLPAGNLVFKYDNTGKVWGIVSEKFASVPSSRLSEIMQDELENLGVELDEISSYTGGVVTYARFTLAYEGSEDSPVRAGIGFRNSVFGGSASRLRTFVRFDDGTPLFLPTSHKFRKIHAGEQEGYIRDFRVKCREFVWSVTSALARFEDMKETPVDVTDRLEDLVHDEVMSEKAADYVRMTYEDGDFPATELGYAHALAVTAEDNDTTKKAAKEHRAEYKRVVETPTGDV